MSANFVPQFASVPALHDALLALNIPDGLDDADSGLERGDEGRSRGAWVDSKRRCIVLFKFCAVCIGKYYHSVGCR